jgi:transcriptional regulator with XRE-family HTH domain
MYYRRINVPALEQLCGDRGWYKHDLAEQSGVSYSTVKSIFYGHQPTPATAGRLARALEVGITDITDPIDPDQAAVA